LVRSREPAVAGDIGDQNRRDFPGLADGAPSSVMQHSTKAGRSRGFVCGLRAIEPKKRRLAQGANGGLGSTPIICRVGLQVSEPYQATNSSAPPNEAGKPL